MGWPLSRVVGVVAALVVVAAGTAGCDRTPHGGGTQASAGGVARARADSVVLITIDTLRADRIGAYGWRAARTPAIDALAARGRRAQRAYATAPITLTSHASVLTGVYPPRHGARHNGMRMRSDVPTLAETLRAKGYATGAFIAAFPLDRRFGLDRGFDVYADTLPRGADGRPRNERPGRDVTNEAIAWLGKLSSTQRSFFLWVHLFEPHAPYDAEAGALPTRGLSDRYDDEVARADVEVGRIVEALGRVSRAASTLVVVTADHGEAFGEHGEIGHSVFVYDTTLHVPLVITGSGIEAGLIAEPVSLVDVAPTILDLLGAPPMQTDGVSLAPGRPVAARALYAESFAPLLDFGWSPLRALRSGREKYIAAPKAELYDIASDPGETRNVLSERPDAAKTLAAQVDRLSAATLKSTRGAEAGTSGTGADPEAVARLRSLGYLASSADARSDGAAGASAGGPARGGRGTAGSGTTGGVASSAGASGNAPARPDPKDRIELASRIAEVTSGELQGPALRGALERLVREDPRNGQMRMRLGFVLLEASACADAIPHFNAAIAAAVPSADPHLGLAECLLASNRRDAARRALAAADRVEPGNPVVAANLGALALEDGRVPQAITHLRAALDRAPDLHAARFALARAYGRAGQRADAAREARTLLERLPADAPQRAEVERLLVAVQ